MLLKDHQIARQAGLKDGGADGHVVPAVLVDPLAPVLFSPSAVQRRGEAGPDEFTGHDRAYDAGRQTEHLSTIHVTLPERPRIGEHDVRCRCPPPSLHVAEVRGRVARPGRHRGKRDAGLGTSLPQLPAEVVHRDPLLKARESSMRFRE